MIADAPVTLDEGAYGGASPWGDPGWRAEVLDWLDAELVRSGLEVDGGIEVRLRPWSVVIRIPVAGAAPVWFKANPPGSAFEPRLTLALDRWLPGSVLSPLAIEADRGWAILPDGGDLLTPRDSSPRRSRRRQEPLRRYAELQRAVSDRVAEMLELGVPDLRPARLSDVLDEMLERTPVAEVLAIRGSVADDAAILESAPQSPTLEHGDLHDWQIFAEPGGRYRFFDWGDASIAHPFTSLRVPVDLTRENDGTDSPEVAAVVDAYLSGWPGDPAELRRLASIATRLASIGRAHSWSRIFPAWQNDDAVAGYRRAALLRLVS